LGPGYVPQSWEKAGAYAGFHGQVGKQSALPHVLTSNAKLMPGDVLVTLATSTVAGYFSELERTMIMGEPSKDQERFFRLMLEARALAIEMMGPGVRCAQVDAAVREFFEANGLMPYWRHHTGHGLGRLLHEPPVSGYRGRAGAHAGHGGVRGARHLRARARRLPALGHGGHHRRRRALHHHLSAAAGGPGHPLLTSC